ncbi:MAG: 30S ribosomal protein S6 [Bacillota bacterium]
MRGYEVMYIIRPGVEEDVLDGIIERFSNIVTGGGGEIVKVDKWGKKRLAYEIKDQIEGHYVLVDFKAPKETSQELDRLMKISDDILRHMIIAKDAS